MGGPKSWRTKKLNSRRSLGDQTTLGTNKIQEAQKLDNPIELDKNFDSPELSEKSSNLVSESKIDMSNFMRFLGGLNRPKICSGMTKTDFKDWGDSPNVLVVENDPNGDIPNLIVVQIAIV